VINLSYPEKNKRPLKKDIMKKAEEAIRQFRSSNTPFDPTDDNGIYSDMLGSYTGMSYDGGEPDQDADDL
jgi:succinate dehydrogenase/fumarate reductase flavoprotein subunit